MTDDRLQRLYAHVVARRPGRDRDTCVSPERMLSLVERRGSEPERLAALDHVMACGLCREEFELLRSIGSAGRHAPKPRVAVLAIAASILVIIGGGVLWQAAGRRAPDTFRGSQPGVALVAPSGEVTSRASLRLTWRPVPQALQYQVEVLDAGGNAIFTGPTRDTALALPDAVPLVVGAEYRWWVRATLRDGDETRSAVGAFRVQSR